jgi:hypothetical protein
MVSQTQVNGAKAGATVDDVTTHISSLAYDLITLAELQVKLLYVDAKEAGARSAASAVSLAAMLVLGLSSIPVLLFGFAELLTHYAQWNRGVACLVVAGVAVVIAGIAGWLCIQKLRTVLAVFSRTHEELYANLEFVKSLVDVQTNSSTNQPNHFAQDRRVRV